MVPAMTGLASVCAVAAMLAATASRRAPVKRRRPKPLPDAGGRRWAPLRHHLAPGTVVTAGAALLPLVQGVDLAHVLTGTIAASCAHRWLQRSRGHRLPGLRELNEYALLVDLLAACLCGGAPLPAALRAVASGSDGPLARAFGAAASRCELGADAEEVAAGLVAASRVLRPLADVLAQAESGAAVASAVQRLAVDARRERRSRLLAAARAAGTRSALPLTLCFLPAFLLVSVVPLLAATATRLLG